MTNEQVVRDACRVIWTEGDVSRVAEFYAEDFKAHCSRLSDLDLAVAFTIGSREGIRVTSYPTSSFHRGPAGRRDHRWRQGYWGTRQSTVRTRQYTEGQLAIDIFDVASQVPVWHGSVARRVTQREQGEPDAALQEAVVAIVAEFPPT